MKRTIKLMAMLLCVAAILPLWSCSRDEDDDNNGINNSLIVGRWELVREYGTDLDGTPFEYDGDGTIVEFKSDGTFIQTDSEGSGIGTYSISGDVLTINYLFVISCHIDELSSTTLKFTEQVFGTSHNEYRRI